MSRTPPAACRAIVYAAPSGVARRSRRHARPPRPPRRTERTPALARLVRGGAAAAARSATPLSPGEQRCLGARNAITDEDRIRILDHAGARAHATTAESPVSVVSDIAGNSRLNLAAPPDLGGAGCPKE